VAPRSRRRIGRVMWPALKHQRRTDMNRKTNLDKELASCRSRSQDRMDLESLTEARAAAIDNSDRGLDKEDVREVGAPHGSSVCGRTSRSPSA